MKELNFAAKGRSSQWIRNIQALYSVWYLQEIAEINTRSNGFHIDSSFNPSNKKVYCKVRSFIKTEDVELVYRCCWRKIHIYSCNRTEVTVVKNLPTDKNPTKLSETAARIKNILKRIVRKFHISEQAAKKQKRTKFSKKRQQYVNAVMAKTGWDRTYTINQMSEAKREIGCSYYVYAYQEFYRMTEEEQREAYAKWLKKQEKKNSSQQEKRNRCLEEAMAATGWDRAQAEAHLDEVIARTGCNPEEYRLYRFWGLDNAVQESFMFMSHTDIIRHKFNLDLNMARLIKDKSAANEYFAKYIGRRWCSNRGTTFEEFKTTFAGCQKLFYKPLASFGGHGARSFVINEAKLQKVYNKIMALPEGVVEEFVVQHPRLSEMSPKILNTVRLTSIFSDEPIDAEGNHFAIPYAMLKMGGATGHVDNLREGGVGAAIDLETGKLCTDAIDVQLVTHTHHPVTGMQIKGFEVPYFAEAKAMVQRIVEENHMQGYLGWDVAITERGPMLIEINGRPSSTLLELPYYNTPLRGRKHVMEKYM